MSRFVLKPARILQTHLTPVKNVADEEYTFEELVNKLVPTRDAREGLKLGRVRQGCFIGLVRSSNDPHKQVVFLLHNPDNSGNIDFVLKADPTFEQRLICAYRVDEAVFDGKITEGRPDQAA